MSMHGTFDEACVSRARQHISSFQEDAENYALIAIEVQRVCAEHKYLRRAMVARDVGARIFDISLDDLLSPRRMEVAISTQRQKLMALCYVLSGHGYREIGELFNRDHSTVVFAEGKFGDEVRRALKTQWARIGSSEANVIGSNELLKRLRRYHSDNIISTTTEGDGACS